MKQTTSKEETWSRGTNSRLPFNVNVILNLSVDEPAKTAGVSAKIQLLYIITIPLFLSLYAHLVLTMNRI